VAMIFPADNIAAAATQRRNELVASDMDLRKALIEANVSFA